MTRNHFLGMYVLSALQRDIKVKFLNTVSNLCKLTITDSVLLCDGVSQVIGKYSGSVCTQFEGLPGV